MAHQILSVNQIPARDGSLDGFEAVCSCGYRMTNAVKSNVEHDARGHVAYMAAAKPARKRTGRIA